MARDNTAKKAALPYCDRMDSSLPVQSGDGSVFVSRRRLLRLAGGAGLVAAASACGSRAETRDTAEHTVQPGFEHTPEPTTQPGPASTPAEPPAPAPSAVSADLLCRDAWGARPAYAGGRTHTITRMTLHHSGVVFGDNRNITQRLRQHQRYHQDHQGWIDIAYHVGVDLDGNIFELRAPELVGDTATDYDPAGHFLVLCEGDFDQQTVPDAQLHGAALTFAWAAQHFGIATDTLASHRDMTPATTCPGANLYQYVVSGELKRRVDELLTTGPVDLQRRCGPDAAALVAAIEAGS
jgi:hypothetical protein